MFENARLKMVQEQIVARGITNENLVNAMKTVKRHLFVLNEDEPYAYSDRPLPIGYNQDTTRPYLAALMIDLAGINKDSKVLEIGTGSGYPTAVMAKIAREVYTVEILEPLYTRAKKILKEQGYDNIKMKLGDGYHGWREYGPYDAIVVTAAPQQEPQPLIEQLKLGGKMIIPVGDYVQELVVITKEKDGIKREKILPVRFTPLERREDESSQ
ncbi:MAG: protein-L-isoaspartate(D-aspartate) O-methyltransferase [Acidobacteria bacterium]|nr:protein-L-isoaspartate(D-aspartate) O-methyltransferase [Acidobacteriota bacterium]